MSLTTKRNSQLYRASIHYTLTDLLKTQTPKEARTTLLESVGTFPELHEKFKLTAYTATQIIQAMFRTTPLGVLPPASFIKAAVDVDTPPSYDISGMTKAELELFAEANGLDVSINQSKADMITEIHAGMSIK